MNWQGPILRVRKKNKDMFKSEYNQSRPKKHKCVEISQKASMVSRKFDTPIRANYAYIYIYYVCTTLIPGLYQGKETYKKIE